MNTLKQYDEKHAAMCRRVRSRIKKLEKVLVKQVEECCKIGFHSTANLHLNERFAERHVLRWVIQKRHKPFCAADF